MALRKKKVRSMRRRPFRKPTLRRLAKYVRFRRPELKIWQDGTEFASIAGAGQMFNLSQIAQGAANGQRVGLWLRPKSLSVRLTLDPTDLVANSTTRVIVFQWMDDYNSPPVTASILSNPIATAYPNALAPYSIPTRQKFKVLYDINVAQGVASADEYNRPRTVRMILRPKYRVKYTDDQDIHYAQSNIFMLIHSTSGAVDSGEPTGIKAQFFHQLTYYDD